MPCSARIDPPAAVTRSSTRRVISSPSPLPVGLSFAARGRRRRGNGRCRRRGGRRRWRSCRGKRFRLASRWSSEGRHGIDRDRNVMRGGGPWRARPRKWIRACFQKDSACASFAARAASSIRPLSASAPANLRACPAASAGSALRFDQHVPAVLPPAASAYRGYARAPAERIVGHQFEPLDRVGRGLEGAQQLRAPSAGLSVPAQATLARTTAGTSRNAPAVITPSVPSAPISNWSRL